MTTTSDLSDEPDSQEIPVLGTGADILPPPAEPFDASIDARRRIDWRFLLPTADLGCVVVVGRVEPDLRLALANATTAGDGRTLLTDDAGGLAPGIADTVVLRSSSPRSLERAHQLLRPGGWLYAELPRGVGRLRMLAALDAGAWCDVARHWHRGGFAKCQAIVRLDRAAPASMLLHRQGGGWGTRLAAMAVRRDIPRWGAPAVSVVARRPAPDPAPTDPASEISVLLTPRFRASRHAIGLVGADDGSRIISVVKIPRGAEGARAITQEAISLDAFQQSVAEPDIAPRVLTTVNHGARSMLVESAVNGHPLDRRRVRRDVRAALDVGLRWLDQVPKAEPTVLDRDGRFDRLLGAPLQRLAAIDGPRAEERRRLVVRTERLIAPLRAASLPTVFEHGDFSHPNLLVLDDGRLAAVDWERAESNGLPAHDLFFFLAYLCAAAEKRGSPPAVVAESYRRAVAGHGWARLALEAYADGMGFDRRLLAPLNVASWLRTTAAYADVAGTLTTATPHRWELMWQVAVADAEERAR